jgi:basic membrane protein A
VSPYDQGYAGTVSVNAPERRPPGSPAAEEDPMRRIAYAAAAAGLLAVLAGGGTSSARQATSGSSGAAAAARFKACLVTDIGGINDKSFNQLSWLGLLDAAAAEPGKITAEYLPSTSAAEYTKNINAFIRLKCGIIVTVGFLMGPATEHAALAHPGRRFAIVDCTYASGCLTGRKAGNLDQLAFNTVQDAFLGGYLAAATSMTHVVATFGGMQFGTITIYMDGFWDGVQYYNSRHHAHVKVLGWNETTQKGIFVGGTNPFGNMAAGRRITSTFIAQGADRIFPVAGGSGLGAAAAVKLADASGKHVALEWPDTDGCFSVASYCRYFLTSVTKGLANEVKSVVLAAVLGRYAREYIGTLANGGVALAPFHDFASGIHAGLRAALAKIEAKIENGTIVPATHSPV